MSKSDRVRLADVRRAVRLVGECRDFGHDAGAWMTHLGAGVRALIGAGVVQCGVQPPGGYQRGGALFHATGVGWNSPAQQAGWTAYIVAERQLADPGFHVYRRRWRPCITVRRADLLTDQEYHATDDYNLYRRVLELDEYMISDVQRPGGPASLTLGVHRFTGDRPFGRRDARLLHLTGLELARLLGRRLAFGPDQLGAGLPPRLRPVLAALLDGDAEKQIAARLGLSRHTVHDYVKLLYRRYEVHSRAELLVLFAVRRTNPPQVRPSAQGDELQRAPPAPSFRPSRHRSHRLNRHTAQPGSEHPGQPGGGPEQPADRDHEGAHHGPDPVGAPPVRRCTGELIAGGT